MKTLVILALSFVAIAADVKPKEGKLTSEQLADMRRLTAEVNEIKVRYQSAMAAEILPKQAEGDAISRAACLAIGIPESKIASECRVQYLTCQSAPGGQQQCSQMVDDAGKPTSRVWWEKPQPQPASTPAPRPVEK